MLIGIGRWRKAMAQRTVARRQRPPERPFVHDDECRTPDAVPEWEEHESRSWRRTCTCNVEHWREPAPADPPPDKAWHHRPGDPCPGATAGGVGVKVERGSADAYWVSSCALCETGPTPWARKGDRPPGRRRGELVMTPVRYWPDTDEGAR